MFAIITKKVYYYITMNFGDYFNLSVRCPDRSLCQFSRNIFDFSMDRREPEAEKYKGPGGVKSGQECVGNVCNRCRL